MVLASSPPRTAEVTDDNFQWLTREEERQAFDEQVRELLGISGEEFLRRLDSGMYRDAVDDSDSSDVMYLSMLASLAR